MTLSDNAIGYLWVAGAIIFFGSFGLPVKTPAVQRAKVDPVVFQCYYSLAVFVSSWLVLFIEPFQWTPYGIGGASLWVPSSVLAITGINFIGMAVAQGVWSGVTIIVSFIWGATLFNEVIDNWYLCILGLVLLLAGIAGISLCNIQKAVQLPKSLTPLYRIIACLKDPNAVNFQVVTDNPIINTDSLVEDEDLEKAPEKSKITLDGEEGEKVEPEKSKNAFLFGLLASSGLGLMNGSMLVPAQLAPSDLQGLAYVISFAIGVGIVTVVLAPIYFLVKWAMGKGLPNFHFKITVIPGLLAGILWNMGNICSIYATYYLGLTIGFPLTQMALLVSALWGMILFREITRIPAIVSFFLSAIILLLGAVLLSLYG